MKRYNQGYDPSYCCVLASLPGHFQIVKFLHSCTIKSGSGLGTRLVVCMLKCWVSFPDQGHW